MKNLHKRESDDERRPRASSRPGSARSSSPPPTSSACHRKDDDAALSADGGHIGCENMAEAATERASQRASGCHTLLNADIHTH